MANLLLSSSPSASALGTDDGRRAHCNSLAEAMHDCHYCHYQCTADWTECRCECVCVCVCIYRRYRELTPELSCFCCVVFQRQQQPRCRILHSVMDVVVLSQSQSQLTLLDSFSSSIQFCVLLLFATAAACILSKRSRAGESTTIFCGWKSAYGAH